MDLMRKGHGEMGRAKREPHACAICDTAFSALLYPTDIPAHFSVTLAGEEWRAGCPGVQCLPRAAKENEHTSSPPASLQ